MSHRDRLLVAAAAIGLIAVALIWGAIGAGFLVRGVVGPNSETYSEYQSNAPQQQTVEAISAALADETCAEIEEQGEADATQRSKQDLCAQFLNAAAASRMARLSFWQTVVGLGGLAAVLFTLGLNAVATFAATNANKLAREQFALERRPWIQVTARILGPFPKGAEFVLRRNFQFRIAYEFKNVGQSPAFDVIFHGPFRSRPDDTLGVEFAERLRGIKEQIRPQTEIVEMRGGKALFPGQVWTVEDYVAHFGDIGEDWRQRWVPVLGLMAHYRIVPEGEFHFTTATWRVVYPPTPRDWAAADEVRLRDWSYRGLHPD